ncbi:MAG: AMP-binding protein [Candidatus Limnocylindrales bacterium]|jgi:long-chain acyl-CoA synthetase
MDRLDSLLDLIDQGEARYGDRFAFGMRGDDGSTEHWTYRELNRRSRIIAWRLRALGLQTGDRLLVWTPSSPAVPALYFGAMRAGITTVPLDLRMSSGAIERIVTRADARHLVLGTGRDTPDPADARLEHFPASIAERLTAEPDSTFPADWEAQVNGWRRPGREDLAEVIFTSGTTGEPKGVMLTHGNLIGTLEAAHNLIPEQEHRAVSLLPISHLFEQVALIFYAMSVGAHVLYVRSRSPRVIFESIRDHRTTSLVLVPQIMDLFWSAIEAEVARQGKLGAFNRLRLVARRLPYPARRRLFAQVHRQFGGSLNLIVSAAAFLPPSLQQAWEDLGVVVMQGYGATECGVASATNQRDHGLGTVGRTIPPVQVKLADDGEILVAGPTLFSGYWRDAATSASSFTSDGWYRTGDIGRHDESGHLILMGRKKDIIVLPNGLNVYPEDVENALRTAGIRDAVVVEPLPGRIEAVVLAPGAALLPQPGEPADATRAPEIDDPVRVRAEIDAAVRAANHTLAVHQRVAAWRLWPDADFPRTHTFKVQRDRVRAWAVIDEPLPVREDGHSPAGARGRRR